MSVQPDPDERFEEVHSILNQLSNSQRHLLTAQVLMNERLDRAELAIQRLAEENVKLAEKTNTVADKVDALTDIIRRWYERHGNGQHPS
ncbi:MAG: hypothetical protein ACLPWF_22825 [Bryobacteraceae bacterium]